MSTKAEEFRYWAQRSGPKKPKKTPRARRDVPVDTSQAGVSATARKAGSSRRPSAAAAKKATYALESSETRPSRKSTRKGKNRQRTDMQMIVKARTSEVSPETRAARRGR